MKRRLFGLLLAVCMVLSLVPVTAFAEDGEAHTLYFENTKNWGAVYAYFWFEGEIAVVPSLDRNPFGQSEDDAPTPDGNNVFPAWPGTAMTHMNGRIWSVEVPAEANRISFSDGGDGKIENLTIPTDGNDLYTDGKGWLDYDNYDPCAEAHTFDPDTHLCIYCNTPDPTAVIITRQPEDDWTLMGGTYDVSLDAEGEGLTYQWYLRNEGSDTWAISAVTSKRYKGTMTNARANREVYCVVTNAYGNTATSDIVKLNLEPIDLAITAQPADDEAATGESFQVTVTAQGDGLKYQWYLKNAGSDTWATSAVTSKSYKGIMADKTVGRQLKCVITDRYGNSVESEVATLIRRPTELKILRQPVNDEAALKEVYDVSVDVQGDGLKYQWYLKNEGSDTWATSAVTSKRYRGTMTKARSNRQIYCVITDAYGNQVTSDIVTISCPGN